MGSRARRTYRFQQIHALVASSDQAAFQNVVDQVFAVSVVRAFVFVSAIERLVTFIHVLGVGSPRCVAVPV